MAPPAAPAAAQPSRSAPPPAPPHPTLAAEAWSKLSFADGTRYAGQTLDGTCHGLGVTAFLSGDRYEGEHAGGAFSGLGVYRWRNGDVYAGGWQRGKLHSCGRKVHAASGRAEAGEFLEDEYVSNFMSCGATQTALLASYAEGAAGEAIALVGAKLGAGTLEELAALTAAGRAASRRRAGGVGNPLAGLMEGVKRWGRGMLAPTSTARSDVDGDPPAQG